MPAPPPPPPLDEAPNPIAHWAHTLALLFILALTTFFGHSRAASGVASTPLAQTSHIVRYSTSILLEWLLLGAVIAGIYRRRAFFLVAFRNRARTNVESFGLGFVVYIVSLFAIAFVGLLVTLTPLAQHRNLNYVLAMLPGTPLDFLLWFAVSLSAGICEELIFRGYLMQQFTAWTSRPIASIFIVALLFGCVHLYEGLGAILPLTALAIVYGFVVRHFKDDLRAVIVAHTLQDFLVGFLGLARPFLERYQATHGGS